MTLRIRPFTHGLHDVGDRCYAWIQPDGAGAGATRDSSSTVTRACNGNELAAESPDGLAMLMRHAPDMGETGEFLMEAFSAFDFEGITRTLPTTTFESDFETRVGDRRVVLKQAGRCHRCKLKSVYPKIVD